MFHNNHVIVFVLTWAVLSCSSVLDGFFFVLNCIVCFILHYALCTVYCAMYTVHCAQYTVHYALCIVPCALCTVY